TTIDVELQKGVNQLLFQVNHKGAIEALYARLLDPERRLRYAESPAKGLTLLGRANASHNTPLNSMAEHPNKHIRDAVKHALGKGWRLRKAGPRAHVWGQLFCPYGRRGGCIIRVFSTPRNPENHARRIREEVDACPHAEAEGEEQ